MCLPSVRWELGRRLSCVEARETIGATPLLVGGKGSEVADEMSSPEELRGGVCTIANRLTDNALHEPLPGPWRGEVPIDVVRLLLWLTPAHVFSRQRTLQRNPVALIAAV